MVRSPRSIPSARPRSSLRATGFAIGLAAALGLIAAPRPAAAADDGATAAVERLHAGMIAVMREAGSTSYAQRFAALAPTIDTAYDLAFMGSKSLGRGFDSLTEADRASWLALFREYTIANFVGRFRAWQGQSFQTLGEEPAAQDTVLVRTRVTDPAETVDLNYRLRRTESGSWKIVDVYLKGTVSELALRRSDFTATLEREGFAGLVASVRSKIADLAAGKAT